MKSQGQAPVEQSEIPNPLGVPALDISVGAYGLYAPVTYHRVKGLINQAPILRIRFRTIKQVGIRFIEPNFVLVDGFTEMLLSIFLFQKFLKSGVRFKLLKIRLQSSYINI